MAGAAGIPADGIVLVDKPAGMTSFGATAAVRRTLGVRKAGHAGTLDPFATGLLIVLVGRARRIQRFFTAMPKTYDAVARLGAVSTTGDPEGEITTTGVVPGDPLRLPTGTIRQRPPAYSAVHVDGERAYARARRGEEVVIPEREVTVYAFEQRWREADRAGLRVHCSSGTYIRSLVADLGDAYTEELRRTSIGPFDVADADAARVIPLAEAVGFFTSVEVDGEAAWRIAHGQPVQAAAELRQPTGRWDLPQTPPEVLVLGADGPVALAELRPGGELKPIVGFRA